MWHYIINIIRVVKSKAKIISYVAVLVASITSALTSVNNVTSPISTIVTILSFFKLGTKQEIVAYLRYILPMDEVDECNELASDADDIKTLAKGMNNFRNTIENPEYVIGMCKKAVESSDDPKLYHQLSRAEMAQAEIFRQNGNTYAAENLAAQEIEHERLSAEKGYAPAQARYGLHLIAHERKQEGVEYVKRALEGSAYAQCLMGEYYLTGELSPYIERSTEEARKLWSSLYEMDRNGCAKRYKDFL